MSLLGRAVVEVEADVFVRLDEMLFPWDAENARWAVLVDVLRAQAVHRVGGEPGAGNATGAILVGVALSSV